MSTDFTKVDRLVDKMMADGLTSLGNDVRKRAVVLAPFDPNRKEPGEHLRATGRVDVAPSSDRMTVSFNKPYARRRHFENNKHPSTKYYLSNALKSIKNPASYFKRFN